MFKMFDNIDEEPEFPGQRVAEALSTLVNAAFEHGIAHAEHMAAAENEQGAIQDVQEAYQGLFNVLPTFN